MIRSLVTEFASFLRNPHPMQATGLNADGAVSRWMALSLLQIAVLGLAVMPLILAWKSAFGLPSPDAFEGLSPLALWGGAVLLAPVLEESFFRGWMSGRLAGLWLTVIVIAGLALFAMLGKGNPLFAAGIALATVVAAGVAWFRTRRVTDLPRWFGRAFPALFYGVTVLFAALHVFNYPQVSPVVLPMVLPQLWSGLMLGYIRVRLGLLASILAHVASNAVMLAAALVTG